MGTSYTVKIVHGDLDRAKLRSEIEAELQRINGLMSTFDENSELSKFNRSPVSSPFPVSPEILEVLELSREIHAHMSQVGAQGGGRRSLALGGGRLARHRVRRSRTRPTPPRGWNKRSRPGVGVHRRGV